MKESSSTSPFSSFQVVSPENPNFDSRPEGTVIDTIVIHSMYAEHTPEPYLAYNCHQLLIDHNVSAHFYIEQAASLDSIWASVPVEHRAWHAGKSKMPFSDDAREAVNDFSIAIELIEAPGLVFSENQYKNLKILLDFLSSKHPIRAIVGHDQIAPDRKIDPGAGFDWSYLKQELTTLRFA